MIVRLFTPDRAVVVEQAFIVWPSESGRLQLDYQYGETTENGASVDELYGILGGDVTFSAGPPWFSPWTRGITDGDESILVGVVEGGYLAVLSDPSTADQGCRPGSLASADELTASILSNSDLRVTAPESTSIDGVDAVWLDVAPALGAEICTGQQFKGVPVVMAHQVGAGQHQWGVKHGDRMRVYLLDVPGDPARTLAILIFAPEGSFDEMTAASAAVVDSITLEGA